MKDFINNSNTVGQSEIFVSKILTCDPYCFMPYKSIEDFNEKEAGDIVQEQKFDDPFFGENIKEAKTVLKSIFK